MKENEVDCSTKICKDNYITSMESLLKSLKSHELDSCDVSELGNIYRTLVKFQQRVVHGVIITTF